MKVMLVPRLSVFEPLLSSALGAPRSYDCVHSWPSRHTVSLSSSESALTTDTPTPWRPPDTL